MRLTRIAVVILLGIAIVSTVACGSNSEQEPTPTPIPSPTPPPLGCGDWLCGNTWIGGCCDTNGDRQYELNECSSEKVWLLMTGQIPHTDACPTPTPTSVP